MFNTILVANTAEAFKGVLLKAKDTKVGAERIRHELTLSQRAFFWESDDKIVITPHLIPLPLFELNKRICGFKNVVNVAPSVGDIELSNTIARDKKLRRLLSKEASDNPQLTISPYAVTKDFLELSDQFPVQVKEKPPSKSLWTVAYLDSKAGFRAEMLKLAAEHKGIKVPQGFVAQDAAEVQTIAEWFYENGQSSILKANFGESGWGIAILKAESYPSLSVFRKQVRKLLQSDVIWHNTSIVVEQFIEPDASVAGGSPSTEVFVSEEGISPFYHCGQLLNEFGGFLGVEIGKGVLSETLARKLTRIGNIIGKWYWELGYRGFFDIDFIISKDGEIYVVETNTRRTGGTHTYDLAKHLFGSEWENEAYLLSHDSFRYQKKRMDAEKVLQKAGPLLYPMKGEQKGIIVTLISEWSSVMGYVVVAGNPDEGRDLQKWLFRVFKK